MKKLISILSILLILMTGPTFFARAEDDSTELMSATSEQETSETPAQESTPSPAPAATADAVRLQVDNANVYEGMDKAYKDGYVPTVDNGVVTVVVPLIASADLQGDQIVVTPSLGDTGSSPIEYKNYQKTFYLAQNTVNNTDDTVSSYLVRFDFPLKSSRINGTYPVTLAVEALSADGTKIQQSFTCYITITDAVVTVATSEAVTQTETQAQTETPESQPKVLISRYSVSPSPVFAGDEFSVTVTLINTSKTQSVQNMVITVSCETDHFVLQNDSNTIYIDKMGAGESMDVVLAYATDLETPAKRYSITLAMSYDNSDAVSLSSSGTLIVETAQAPNVEVAPFRIESEVNAGETIQLSFQVMNLGRSTVYNVRLELSVNGLLPTGTAFIGTMEAGTDGTAVMNVFVGAKTMSESYTGEERYGNTVGELKLIYEDAGGQEYVQETIISTTINELVVGATDNTQEEPQTASQWWITVGIGVVIVAALAVAVRRTKKRAHVRTTGR